MTKIRFEWDPRKAATNEHKHGISFKEAATVFLDEKALMIDDPEHSEDEDRYILLGISNQMRLIVVCHCYREDDEILRIISARKATRKERIQYLERNHP